MRNDALFDRYAGEYRDAVDGAIRASGYDADHFSQLKARLVAREVIAQPPAAVLDFGCGIGDTTRALRRALGGVPVTGIDVSPRSIAVARERSAAAASGESFVVSDGAHLPFADGTFDLAFAACVFHHIGRDEHLLWARELRRVLRPGGTFFLFEHNPFNPLTRRVVATCPFDEGVTLLTPRYARGLLRASGFAPARPRFYFFFPKLLRFLRGLEPGLSWCPLGAQYYVAGAGEP